MHGVTSNVSPVAKARPPAIALDNCVHHWVDGAPHPIIGLNRSIFMLSTIGIKPSMVVIAVSKTGRNLKQPVSSAASKAVLPACLN